MTTGAETDVRITNATRLSLLSQVRTLSNDNAWKEFVDTYWSLIYGVARKSRLEHHDAEEIAQEVIIEVAGKMKEFRYDRSKGSFRAWLRNLTRTGQGRSGIGRSRAP
jgi:RNA polymerase sigma-70 factor (ECF subfamily)